MNDLATSMIVYFGTIQLMTASNIYTIALTFYGALFLVLWYFRRGERYKMFPNVASGIIYVSLLCCSYIFALGQYFDHNMVYYPFAFFSNLVVIGIVIAGIVLVYLIKYLVELREHFPKQD